MALTELRRPAPASRAPGSVNRAATRRPGGELLSPVLLAAGLISAFAGFHVVVSDSSWFFAGSGFILLVLTTTTVTRRFVASASRRRWLPTVVGAVVALLGLTLAYAADVAPLGVIPDAEVLARFGHLSDAAWLSIAEQDVPATPELGIVFLLVLLCAGCALFGDLVVRRAPALTAIPLLTLLGVPVAVRAGIADPYWFVPAVVAYLLLLRRGQWRSSVPSIVLGGAAVIIGALIAPNLLPPVDEAEPALGTGLGTGVNPLIDLGNDLRQGTAATALTYTTSSDQGMYLRLATLDDFDGRQWSPSTTEPPSKNSVDQLPPPVGLTSDIGRAPLTASVKVGPITGRWLPVPYPLSSISGLTGHWRYEPDGLSIRSEDSSAGGQDYDLSFLDVQPDLTQLRAATTADAGVDAHYLSLPRNMPPIIAATAQQVTSGAGTEYDQALALQNYFQNTGGFTYSETAPVQQGYDGTGAQIIAQFLQKKEGYCVHFASAMAVMARTLGIPSRVAVGFQPGASSLTDDNTVFTVSTHDLHAWPELYFAGIGWLRFEPTVGRGVLPDYSDPAAVDDNVSQTADGDTPAPSDAASVSPSVKPKGLDLTNAPQAGAAAGTGGRFNPAGIVLLVLAALLVLAVATPAAVRWGIRRSRLRAVARGRDPAQAAWAEVRDTARDHGWAAPDSETARDFARRLKVGLVDGTGVDGFRAAVEHSAYAEDPAALSVAELRALLRSISRSVSGRERVRAVLLPASLVNRIRGPQGGS